MNRCPKCAMCLPVTDLSSHVRGCRGDFDSDLEADEPVDLTKNEER